MFPGDRFWETWLGFGSLKVSSILTSKDGYRIWTFPAKEGSSRVKGHPKNTARTEHRQETGEAGESRQPFTPRLRGKFPNDVRNGRFRPVLEQVSWGCCTVNKIRWFSITV